MGQTQDNSGRTAAEQRILHRAAKGRIASFDRDDDPDDPADITDWTGREVSASFVRKLAKGKKKWPVGPEGVRISGVRVVGRLDLADTELAHPLGFQRSMIPEPISLEGARTKSLAFVRSRVGPIAAGGLQCDGSLELAQSAVGAVDLSAAIICGDLTTDAALLVGGLDTEGATIEGDAYPPEARHGIHPAGWRGLSNGAQTHDAPTENGSEHDDATTEPPLEVEVDEPVDDDLSPSDHSSTDGPLSARIAAGTISSPEPTNADVTEPTEADQLATPTSVLPELPSPGELPPGAVEVTDGHRKRRLTVPRVLLLWLAAIALAAVVAFLAPDDVFRADANGQDTAAECGGEIECFNEVAYAVDLLVPTVDLDQENTWHPDGSADNGALYRAARWIGIGLGWLLTVALVVRGVESIRRRS